MTGQKQALASTSIEEYSMAPLVEKEYVSVQFIVINTRISHQISHVLPHGTAPNYLFPVPPKKWIRKEQFNPVRIRT